MFLFYNHLMFKAFKRLTCWVKILIINLDYYFVIKKNFNFRRACL